jgi:hypothetical protein
MPPASFDFQLFVNLRMRIGSTTALIHAMRYN